MYLNFNRQSLHSLIQHRHSIWPFYHTMDIPIIRIGTVPHRTVPYATVSYRTVPYHTVPYRTLQHLTVLYRTVPYFTIALLKRHITVIVQYMLTIRYNALRIIPLSLRTSLEDAFMMRQSCHNTLCRQLLGVPLGHTVG